MTDVEGRCLEAPGTRTATCPLLTQIRPGVPHSPPRWNGRRRNSSTVGLPFRPINLSSSYSAPSLSFCTLTVPARHGHHLRDIEEPISHLASRISRRRAPAACRCVQFCTSEEGAPILSHNLPRPSEARVPAAGSSVVPSRPTPTERPSSHESTTPSSLAN